MKYKFRPDRWDLDSYPLSQSVIDLHIFQSYILQMAALDHVTRPPMLDDSGEEVDFYQAFQDEHVLLLSWVLNRGFSEPKVLYWMKGRRFSKHNRISIERLPFVSLFLNTALNVRHTRGPSQRFSERTLPTSLSRYASSDSAGLSGFRMNVLWAAAKRYAQMMIENAAKHAETRYVRGDTEHPFGFVMQARFPERAVYLEDVNLVDFCAVNAGFEEFVFSRDSSCRWWWDEERHADNIRELLKHTVRLALEMECKRGGVELVIGHSAVVASTGGMHEGDMHEGEDSQLKDEHPSNSSEDMESYEEEDTNDNIIHDVTTGTQTDNIVPETTCHDGCLVPESRSPSYSPPCDDYICESHIEEPAVQYPQDYTDTSFATVNTIQLGDGGWKPFEPTPPTRVIMINGKWVRVVVPQRQLSPTITEDMLIDYPKHANLDHLLRKPAGGGGGQGSIWETRRAGDGRGANDYNTHKQLMISKMQAKKEAKKAKKALQARARLMQLSGPPQETTPAKGKEVKKAEEGEKAGERRGRREEKSNIDEGAPESSSEYMDESEPTEDERAPIPVVKNEGVVNKEVDGGRWWLRGRQPGEDDGFEYGKKGSVIGSGGLSS